MVMDEAALAAYLDKYIERRFDRLLLHKVFEATVVSVNWNATPVQVQIQRLGEQTSDDGWYACPNFFPLFGDRVKMFWLDDRVAIVLCLLSRIVSSGWVAPPQTVSGTSPSFINFPNIPQNFTNLVLTARCGTTDPAVQFLNFQFNGISGNYDSELLQANNTAAAAAVKVRAAASNGTIGVASGTNNAEFNGFTWTLLAYSQAKPQVSTSVNARFDAAGSAFAEVYSESWTPTPAQAITQIVLSLAAGLFAVGSYFSLRGEP